MARIGKLQLDPPLFQAALAGYSDTAMRLIARRLGCPYCLSEALLDRLLVHGGRGRRAAELDELDHPIGGQIIGDDPATMARAATILVKMGYDVIDVNLACPVRKIRRKGRGGHLLAEPAAAIAILDAVRQAVPDDVPCTVKLRRATDESPKAAANFFRIFEAAITLGYAAATVHARTVAQKYLGPSHWPFLTDLVKQYAPNTPHAGATALGAAQAVLPHPTTPAPFFSIFGSGDIWQAADVLAMIAQTGVAAVSVARGAIGNPWIFQQVRALLAGDRNPPPPSLAEQRHVLAEHFDLVKRVHGDDRAGTLMRKFGIYFARLHPSPDAVEEAFIAVKRPSDWSAVLDRWYNPPPLTPHPLRGERLS